MIAFPFVYIAMLMAWIILLIGIYNRDYTITEISSLFIIIIGIYILVNGIEGMYNIAIEGIGILHIAVGGYYAVTKGIELIEMNL
mgnify:CR=1 FL=1